MKAEAKESELFRGSEHLGIWWPQAVWEKNQASNLSRRRSRSTKASPVLSGANLAEWKSAALVGES